MIKSSSCDYINYITYFGPLSSDNSCFAEYGLEKAVLQKVQPWEFKSHYTDYQNQIDGLISRTIDDKNVQGKIIFISGHAGDGKTHFIRHLLASHENGHSFYNEQVFTQLISPQKITAIKNTSNFDENLTCLLVADQLIKLPDFIKSLSYPLFDLHVITDLTTITSNDMEDLIEIFQNILVDNFGTKTILLIAGNDGKILEILSKLICLCEQKKKAQPNKALTFTRLASALKDKLLQLQALFIEQIPINAEKEQVLSVFDMAQCINAELIRNIFHEVLQSTEWYNCATCKCSESNMQDGLPLCPILHNRELLLIPSIQNKIIEVFTLLKNLGYHFTVRQILMIISNTLVGRKNTAKSISPQQRMWSCAAVKRNQTLGFNYSEIFDNFFGLNLSRNMLSTSINAEKRDVGLVYSALNSLEIGSHSNYAINKFLQATNKHAVQAFLQKVIGEQNLQMLDKTYAHLNGTISQATTKENDLNTGSQEIDHLANLAHIRRHLFFTLDLLQTRPQGLIANEDPLLSNNQSLFTEINSTNNDSSSLTLPFSPYKLSAYPHAQDFFTLTQAFVEAKLFVNDHYHFEDSNLENFIQYPNFACLPQLFLGLNKVFTLLPIQKDPSSKEYRQIYIPFDSYNSIDYKICILDEDYYELSPMSFTTNSINLALRNKNNLQLILFYKGLQANTVINNNLCLHITPKTFEYLSQLAQGKLSYSFSPEMQSELISFKKAIFREIQKDLYIVKKSKTNHALRMFEQDNKNKTKSFNNLSKQICFKYLNKDGDIKVNRLD